MSELPNAARPLAERSPRARYGALALAAVGLGGSFFVALALSSSPVYPKKLWAERLPGLAAVEPEDGIDEREASRIAEAHFATHSSSMCGGPSRPRKHGDWWYAEIHLDFPGDRDGGTIHISATSGAIWSTFARPYSSYGSFRQRLADQAE